MVDHSQLFWDMLFAIIASLTVGLLGGYKLGQWTRDDEVRHLTKQLQMTRRDWQATLDRLNDRFDLNGEKP